MAPNRSSADAVVWRCKVSVAPFQLLRSTLSSWSTTVTLGSIWIAALAGMYGTEEVALGEKASSALMLGPSFTGVIVSCTVSLALENAVPPPLLVTAGLVPALPVLWSHAWNIRPAAIGWLAPSLPLLVLTLALGWKYSSSVERNSKAAPVETLPTAFQVDPVSVL